MSDDDLIEAVARAICIAVGDDPDQICIAPYLDRAAEEARRS